MKLFKALVIRWADRQINKELQKSEKRILWNKVARLNHIATQLESTCQKKAEDTRKANALWEKLMQEHPADDE